MINIKVSDLKRLRIGDVLPIPETNIIVKLDLRPNYLYPLYSEAPTKVVIEVTQDGHLNGIFPFFIDRLGDLKEPVCYSATNGYKARFLP